MSVYPALEGVLARLCVCLCVCVWASVCGHEAVRTLRWQMALLHCRATLANRGRTGRRWERRRRKDVSQREGWVRMVVKMKIVKGVEAVGEERAA